MRRKDDNGGVRLAKESLLYKSIIKKFFLDYMSDYLLLKRASR